MQKYLMKHFRPDSRDGLVQLASRATSLALGVFHNSLSHNSSDEAETTMMELALFMADVVRCCKQQASRCEYS